MIDLFFIALGICLFYGIWSLARDLFQLTQLLRSKKPRRRK
ncbi:MAG: hypothetical protein JWQ49_4565 [Edaphobacter sp.]|nr:hypothetical protein [Edaphobacter sp.]